MTAPKSARDLPRECLAAGIAGAIADAILNPSTVLQVRAQISPHMPIAAIARESIASAGGVFSGLWLPGLPAICLRALTYSGFRVGCYPSVRDRLPGDGFASRVVAGSITGAGGAALFAPCEVVRVRMVAGAPYSNTIAAFASIARAESITGLWRGASLFALRAGCFSGAQLATYETCKKKLVAARIIGGESAPLHFAASLLSGVCAQLVAHPFDTLKTLVMHSGSQIRPVLHELVASGAMLSQLYAGLTPALLSRGPMVMIFLPLTEQVRTRVFGLGYI